VFSRKFGNKSFEFSIIILDGKVFPGKKCRLGIFQRISKISLEMFVLCLRFLIDHSLLGQKHEDTSAVIIRQSRSFLCKRINLDTNSNQ